MRRASALISLLVLLPACRGCSSPEDLVSFLRGGARQEDPEAFAREFGVACRKEGEETYCDCMLQQVQTRFDAAQLKDVGDALEKGELPPPAFADAADACGADGDVMRVGRPFRRDVVDAILSGCRSRHSEEACTCIVSSLESRFALFQVRDGVEGLAKGQPSFGPVAEVEEACDRADFERQRAGER